MRNNNISLFILFTNINRKIETNQRIYCAKLIIAPGYIFFHTLFDIQILNFYKLKWLSRRVWRKFG